MNKWIIWSCIFLVFLACAKEDEPDGKRIVGEWKAIESKVDPGDGSGKFRKYNGDGKIEFFRESTLVTNLSLCPRSVIISNVFSGTYDTLENIIVPDSCDLIWYSYTFDGSNLIMNYPWCIEGCQLKFVKLD